MEYTKKARKRDNYHRKFWTLSEEIITVTVDNRKLTITLVSNCLN